MKKNTITQETVKATFEANEGLSLKGFATSLGLTYQIVLNASKKPIAGQLYDPEAKNFEAIAAVVAKKVELDQYEAVDWSSVVTTRSRNASVLKDTDQITEGMKVWLRTSNVAPYEVLFKTTTHVVIMQTGTQEPIAWCWNTFFLKGPKLEQREETTTTTTVEEEGVA